MPGSNDQFQYPTTYQYKSTDQPQSIASQFNISTSQLLSANPGGYPFNVGQTIKIPQYSSPIGPTPPAGYQGLTPSQSQNIPAPAPSFNNPHPYRGATNTPTRAQTAESARLNGMTNLVIQNQLANGIPPAMIPAGVTVINPQTGRPATPEDMAASGYTFNPKTNSWGYNQNTGLAQLAPPNGGSPTAPNNDFMNTGFMKDYTANNVGFYDQKRWDPTAQGGKGAFVKIGDLIRQGKFDERTGKAPLNKNSKPKAIGGGNSVATAAQPAQSNANVNTVLSVNLGSG